MFTGGTWDYYLAAPFFNAPPHAPTDVTSMAMIGLAGGTIPKQYSAVFGPIPIDGIEIDPAIAQAGRDYFDMSEPNLNVIVEDGRFALSASPRQYDVIGVDAYRLPYIPWHLTTVEFFQEVHDHLSEEGVLAINVGRTSDDRRLIEALAGTMSAVFPSIHVIDVPRTCNSIMVSTVQPTTPDNLLANRALMVSDAHPLLLWAVQSAADNIAPTPVDGPVFTDDRAPTEQLTDLILVNFLFSGSDEIPCF
jgi:spermidine synthase